MPSVYTVISQNIIIQSNLTPRHAPGSEIVTYKKEGKDAPVRWMASTSASVSDIVDWAGSSSATNKRYGVNIKVAERTFFICISF